MGKTRRTCNYPGCATYLTPSQAHCRDHSHVNALQQAIDAQNQASPSGVASLVKAYDPLRRVIVALNAARWLAEPGKSKTLATVGRGGFDDGTVDYGNGVVHSSAAAAVKQHQGQLGAMVSVLSRTADEMERILDPNRERKDLRVSCGRDTCDSRTRWRRQPPDSRYCRWCGGEFTAKTDPANTPDGEKRD